MKLSKASWMLLVLAITLSLAGCGDSSSPTPSRVSLQSDSGENIGGGKDYSYTQADAKLSVTASGNTLTVTVDGDQHWTGIFQTSGVAAILQTGRYDDVLRYPSQDPVKGGMDWFGEGRGSNTLSGWFAIDKVTYNNGTLKAIDLRFELHSEGDTPALHGQIHWYADDLTTPPGPVTPPPAGLWQPPAGATPDSGNYVYLESEPGDFIGQGQTHLFTESDVQISVSESGGLLSVTILGPSIQVIGVPDFRWDGFFRTMEVLEQLQPGYYGNLMRYPFNNPVKGGLDWSGVGRGSNTLTGWFVVDNAIYDLGVLMAVDLRFEQHSEGAAPALHGKIHWVTH